MLYKPWYNSIRLKVTYVVVIIESFKLPLLKLTELKFCFN